MFVYEVAAELKAQTERTMIVYSKATFSTVVNVLSATYNFITSFSTSKSHSRKARRSKKSKRIVPPSPSFASTLYDDDIDQLDLGPTQPIPTDVNQLMEQMRILQEQMTKFAQMQAALSQATTPATSTTTSTISSSSNITSSGSELAKIDPNAPPCPILDLDTPHHTMSHTGTYYKSNQTAFPKPTKITASASVPASQPMNIVDALKNGRPQLRHVAPKNKEDTENEAFSPIFNKTLKPSNVQRDSEKDKENDFEPVPLTINGKKLVTQTLPGQENMSFADLIKVASKVSLHKLDVERSPGGTPINKRPIRSADSIFSTRLQEKFKLLHAREAKERDSIGTNLGALEEQDKENWD